ncbi:hypothetical protein CBR_g32605 [Chara braunii]|uniref:Uncharacterized protein n=1 Tax=Chara braunii TaxID=69332 RepID=A0A388LHB0_CHABU|nr:hypothetical protein CBR_g32605 [Chara braunii]|eukprot:GBG81613.1 hypothetical protein CBR_g32605 [Chara braunii]
MASEGAVADLSGGDDTCAAEAVGSDECKSTEAAGAVTVENKYEVEIVNIERQYTVGIRKVVPVAEIAEFFRPAVENVLAFAEKNNLPKPEMTYGRYYKYDKKIFDVECGIIVPKGTKGLAEGQVLSSLRSGGGGRYGRMRQSSEDSNSPLKTASYSPFQVGGAEEGTNMEGCDQTVRRGFAKAEGSVYKRRSVASGDVRMVVSSG